MIGKLIGAAVALAAVALMILFFGNARHDAGVAEERARWKDREIEWAGAASNARILGEQRIAAANAAFADRLADMAPIIIRSTNTVTKYAQTIAGAELCLPAERVRGIEQDASALNLATAPAAIGGAGTMLTVPAHPEP